MPWIVHGAARHPRSVPRSGVTVPSPLNHQTAGPWTPCQMAALYTLSGTASGIVLRAARCPADIIDALGGWSHGRHRQQLW